MHIYSKGSYWWDGAVPPALNTDKCTVIRCKRTREAAKQKHTEYTKAPPCCLPLSFCYSLTPTDINALIKRIGTKMGKQFVSPGSFEISKKWGKQNKTKHLKIWKSHMDDIYIGDDMATPVVIHNDCSKQGNTHTHTLSCTHCTLTCQCW